MPSWQFARGQVDYAVFPYNSHLLRQLRPAPRACLHDRGRRRARPPSPPRGEEVFFLTGTDEHGAKVAQAAAAAGLSPKEFCDRVSARFRDLVERLEASNDFFIRTTDPEHERRVQDFMVRLRDARRPVRGHLLGPLLHGLRAVLRGVRADAAGKHLPDPHDPRSSGWRSRTRSSACPRSARSCSSSTTATPSTCCPAPATTRPARSSSRASSDFSVSRASVSWGMPLPWKPEQTIYVWVDALLNYHTALEYGLGHDVSQQVLALAASAGQGHPAAALRRLAGAADGGRATSRRASCSCTAI